MKAIHGGKAKNDKIDAHKIAVLLRGGMVPQAYVYPAAMRATRDLLRRRMYLARKRAELLTHVQNTNHKNSSTGNGGERVSLAPNWTTRGSAYNLCSAIADTLRRCTPTSTEASILDPYALIGRPLSLLCMQRWSSVVHVGCHSPEPGTHWTTIPVAPFL